MGPCPLDFGMGERGATRWGKAELDGTGALDIWVRRHASGTLGSAATFGASWRWRAAKSPADDRWAGGLARVQDDAGSHSSTARTSPRPWMEGGLGAPWFGRLRRDSRQRRRGRAPSPSPGVRAVPTAWHRDRHVDRGP
ncbi:unnamed protein product [Diplocarpon coronariae]|nr:hypothetical protein JHW43_007560 [Diplocarpon mali]